MSTAKRKQVNKAVVGCLCFALVAAGMAAAPDVPCLSGIGAVSVSAAADPVSEYVAEIDLSQILNYANDSALTPNDVEINKRSDYNDGYYEIVLSENGKYRITGSNNINGAYVNVQICVVGRDRDVTIFFDNASIINDECDYHETYGCTPILKGIEPIYVNFFDEISTIAISGKLSLDTAAVYTKCERGNDTMHSAQGIISDTGRISIDKFFTVEYVDENGVVIDKNYYLKDQTYNIKPSDYFDGDMNRYSIEKEYPCLSTDGNMFTGENISSNTTVKARKAHVDTNSDKLCDICRAEIKCIVNFDTNGGSLLEAEQVSNGKTLSEPTVPTKDGYVFGGWYTDEALTTTYDFTSAVTSDMTLYAKWVVEVDLNDLLDQYINGRGQNTGSMEYAKGVTVNKYSGKYSIDLNNSGFYKFTGSNMVNGAYVDVMIQNNGVAADVEFDNASIINSEYYISTDDSLAYGTVPFSVYGGKLTVSGTLSVDTIADYHGTNNRVDDLFYATGSGEFNAGDFFKVKYVDEDGNVIDKNYFLGGNGQTYDVKPSSYVGSDEKMHSISEEFPCVPSIVKNVSENKTISARKTHIDEDSDHECDNCGESAKVTGIEIDTAPTKTSYFIGQELDVTGGTITVSYEFGEDKTVDITADMVSGFDSSEAGTQTLTVTYGEETDTFDVTFSEAKITDIELYSTPAKTSYSIGDKLDVTGGRLKVFYEDGSSDIIDITADMVTGFDSTKEGTNTLTVTYGGKTVTFTVTIEKGAVTILPSDNNVGGAVIDMPIEDLMAAVLDEEDLELIAQGVDIGVLMATVTIDPEYVPEADKTAIDDVLNDFTIGCYLDVKLFKTYSNGAPDRQVTDPNAPIIISFEVPQYIIDQYPENEYVYSVFCSHNEIGYHVESRYDADTNIMSFSSDKFSTYALGVKPYAEYSITSEDSHVTVEGTANAGDIVKVIVDDGYQATVSDADGNVIAEITGTGTFTMPDCDVTITCEQIIISEPSKSVVYYSISTDSHVTVNGTKYKEGDKVSYRVDDFYEAVFYVNGRATGRISGSGSFTMPAADVRIVSGMDEISYAMLTASVVNSYVYSYDSDMNPIKTSGTKKKNNYIIIDLGEEYAGRTITIYKGRKSTKTVVAEGVLDKNGKFKFDNAGFGSNYTLIVGD